MTKGVGATAGLPASVSTSAHALSLTSREREIAQLVADGLSDKEIAANLSMSLGTVRTHLHRAYARNGLAGRVSLVVAWLASPQRATALDDVAEVEPSSE